MQVIFNVRDHLTDTSTTSDIEVMAVAASAKAQEYVNCTSPKEKEKMLQFDSKEYERPESDHHESDQHDSEIPVATDEDEQTETGEPNETDENDNVQDRPQSTLLTPRNQPTDSEEDIFSQKMNEMSNSVPIKTEFKPQQLTEQLHLLQESE